MFESNIAFSSTVGSEAGAVEITAGRCCVSEWVIALSLSSKEVDWTDPGVKTFSGVHELLVVDLSPFRPGFDP